MADDHPYLTGHHAPVQEERVAFDLAIRGRLPVGLDGVYVRTGPNALPDADPGRYHRLTGDGMLHGIRLNGGRAEWYRNRWVVSPDVARATSRAPPELPDAMVPEGTGNTSVLRHAGQLYAFSEMSLPYALSDTLETLGGSDFGGPMPAGSIAHPRHDVRSGELHTLAYHLEPPYLRHHVVDARGRLRAERALPVSGPVMVHDFALTATHLGVFDLPVRFDEEAMMDGEPLPYRWCPGEPAFVRWIPREGDAEAGHCFEIDPCWIPHVAAVQCRGDLVSIDAIRRPSLFAEDLRGDDDGAPVLVRCRLDLRRGTALVEIEDDRPQDFPVGDPRLPGDALGAYHTLGIAERDGRHGSLGDRILHRSLTDGSARVHRLPSGWLASELRFVPAHERAVEGEGWLIGFLHDERGTRSRFVVLDAQALDAGPVAEIDLPDRVPAGFHGCWVAD